MPNHKSNALSPTNLRRAWNDVADNGGGPGVDNVTIAQWKRNWEERLIELARAVRGNQYKPGGLRIRRIPKPNAPDMRVLRIPTLTDRILQRAVYQQLAPICERRFFACSYGYRPGRGLQDAVRHITRLRKQNYHWVLDADIDDFFNQIDHALLRRFLRLDFYDTSLLPLINQWLQAWQIQPTEERGIAMGSPLSPLLANIYLHRLDDDLQNHGYKPVRYADDFVVLSSNPPDWRRSYVVTERALHKLKLRYEPRKTQLTTFEEGFEFLGVHFEEGWYWYTWDDKRIEVRDGENDEFFHLYGPEY